MCALEHTPQAEWLLYGIKPVVIAIIAQALWSMGQKAVKGPLTAAVAVIVIVLYFVGINEIALLFAGGLIVMLGMNYRRLKRQGLGVFIIPMSGVGVLSQVAMPFSFSSLFLIFLKIGAVLYGSGYVLLAFLRADFVVRLGLAH